MKKTLALSAVLALGIMGAACPGDAPVNNANNGNKPATNAANTPASTPVSTPANVTPPTNGNSGGGNMNKPADNTNKPMANDNKPMNKNS